MKMDLKQKAVINSIGSLIVFFAQWLISVLIVRVSGYAEAGIFSLAMSISNVFSFFTNYNIRNFQVSDAKHEYTQLQYFHARLFTAMISMIACIAYLILAKGYDTTTRYAIFAYLVYSNINMVSDIMLGTLQLHNRLEINGYSNMMRGAICFVGFMTAHIIKKNILLSLWVMVIGDFIFTFMYDGRLYKQIEGRLSFLKRNDFHAIGGMLKNCFLLMLSGILPIVTTAVPRRYIQSVHGEEALGFFSSIFTPTVLITTIAPALILAVVPIITDYWERNKKGKLYKTIFGCYFGCAAIIILADMIALICGKQVMALIYGESILEYYNLLYWAIATTGLNAMTSCGNAVLIPMRKNRVVALAALSSTLFTILSSRFLIEKYHIYGAAYTLLWAYAIHVLIQIGVIVAQIIKKKGKKIKMKKKIVIDGRQLGKMMGGVQRYIVEMLNELDKIAPPEKYEILVPKGTEIENKYSNLKVVRYGSLNGLLWEQLCLPFYLWKNKVYGVFPCTIVPLLFPKGVVVLHDVMMARCPELGESFSNPIARKLLFMNYKIAAQRADVVITDAENSKTDIVDLYHRDPQKIYVIGAGWQHIQRVIENDDWMDKYPQIKEGEYYFSLSANRRQKNFKWIYEMAKRYPKRIFAMAGTQEEWQREQEYSTPNIVHMGYISDGTIKSLMRHCKAFLFPSLYEGFGIPPLEALAVGAKIIVARTSCLPEIYQDSAYYIDPYDYDVDLDELLCQKVVPAGKVLERFGWDISARRLDEICDILLNQE